MTNGSTSAPWAPGRCVLHAPSDGGEAGGRRAWLAEQLVEVICQTCFCCRHRLTPHAGVASDFAVFPASMARVPAATAQEQWRGALRTLRESEKRAGWLVVWGRRWSAAAAAAGGGAGAEVAAVQPRVSVPLQLQLCALAEEAAGGAARPALPGPEEIGLEHVAQWWARGDAYAVLSSGQRQGGRVPSWCDLSVCAFGASEGEARATLRGVVAVAGAALRSHVAAGVAAAACWALCPRCLQGGAASQELADVLAAGDLDGGDGFVDGDGDGDGGGAGGVSGGGGGGGGDGEAKCSVCVRNGPAAAQWRAGAAFQLEGNAVRCEPPGC